MNTQNASGWMLCVTMPILYTRSLLHASVLVESLKEMHQTAFGAMRRLLHCHWREWYEAQL
jgi:hypothetical protein